VPDAESSTERRRRLGRERQRRYRARRREAVIEARARDLAERIKADPTCARSIRRFYGRIFWDERIVPLLDAVDASPSHADRSP
jgi:hypothetical protein